MKVLDFGLAKAWEGEAADGKSSSSGLSQSPTLANTGTVAGLILGTAAYMSPEQARGKPVDKRADVWSFGALLWEMLAGRTLFAGETVTDVIAAVVKEELDLDALPAATPPAVRRLVGRCLRKDRRTRMPDIGAARLELQDVLSGAPDSSGAEMPDGAGRAGTQRQRLTRERRTWAAALLLAAGLGAAVTRLLFAPAVEPPQSIHFAVGAAISQRFATGSWNTLAAAPDGLLVAYAAGPPGGPTQLFVRALGSPVARPLAGTEGADQPAWSPDGEILTFFARGELHKVNLASGTVQRICDLPESGPIGATWSDDGTLLFATGLPTAKLYTVPASGGEARLLTPLDTSRGEANHAWPRFLPGQRRFMFVVASAQADRNGVYVASLDAPEERRRVLPEAMSVEYASGHLLFVRDGFVMAQPFDATGGEVAGDAVAISSANVASEQVLGFSTGRVTASQGGLLAYVEGGGLSKVQLTWLDRQGRELGTLGEPAIMSQIVLSPDGRRVAAEIPDAMGRFDIWAVDVDRGVGNRLTSDPGDERDPVWSPDGQELVFGTATAGGKLMRKVLTTGASSPVLPESSERHAPESWSLDGKTLFYSSILATEVWAVPMDGKGQPQRVLETQMSLDEPQISPNGRWLAYTSGESGRAEVYVVGLQETAETVRVSPAGAGQPKWRRDGRELFYVTGDSQLEGVEVRESTTGLRIGLPTRLFELTEHQGAGYDDYAVSPDGQRFLVKVPVGEPPEARLHVVTNWTSLLEE